MHLNCLNIQSSLYAWFSNKYALQEPLLSGPPMSHSSLSEIEIQSQSESKRGSIMIKGGAYGTRMPELDPGSTAYKWCYLGWIRYLGLNFLICSTGITILEPISQNGTNIYKLIRTLRHTVSTINKIRWNFLLFWQRLYYTYISLEMCWVLIHNVYVLLHFIKSRSCISTLSVSFHKTF